MSSVLVIFIYPLIGICTALLYYDLRWRRGSSAGVARRAGRC